MGKVPSCFFFLPRAWISLIWLELALAALSSCFLVYTICCKYMHPSGVKCLRPYKRFHLISDMHLSPSCILRQSSRQHLFLSTHSKCKSGQSKLLCYEVLSIWYAYKGQYIISYLIVFTLKYIVMYILFNKLSNSLIGLFFRFLQLNNICFICRKGMKWLSSHYQA